MPRARLNVDRVLTPTERSRRHRLRLRGVEVPDAPRAPTPADEFERLLGCKLLTLEELCAAAVEAGISRAELASEARAPSQDDDDDSEEAA
jgi:hypothetical protein